MCRSYFFKLKTDQVSAIPFVIKSTITDHFTTALQIVSPDKNQPNPPTKPHYKNILNMEKLKKTLSEVHWENLYIQENAETATQFFINILETEIRNCTKKIKINSKHRKRTEWITDGLISSINKKNELRKKMIRDPENTNLKEEYKRYRNKLTGLIKLTKADFYKKQIDENIEDPKKLWKVVNEVTQSKKCDNRQLTKIRKNNGEVTNNDADTAEEFNCYFTEIGNKLISSLTSTNVNINKNSHIHKNTIFLLPTDEDEVKREINSLKKKKATGFDGISAEILKATQNEISTALTYIINKIIETGDCPTHFKISVVKPIFKKGDDMVLGNYRPISLISSLAKIFEKVIKTRLTNFLNKDDLLAKNQFGFRNGKNTQDAINVLTDKIYKSLDKRTKSLCIFIDIQKAFDTVSHSLLLEKLNNIGIRGICQTLLRSYLTGRKQYVQINDTQSPLRDVTCGVPQGTVLGPMLFNIYINDLFEVNTKGHIVAFADDTAIYYEDQSWNDLKQKVEMDMEKILAW